ncbi:MAG TPA: twin-arginine translocase subunit TatC [Vicinamibacterales bacterium]|nr:twin-arginine translocase subunit TatC [Vicinamibacterales bacterium]
MALVPFPQKNALQKREPDWDDSDESLDDSGKMSFLEHLDELRKRIIWSLVGVAVGVIIACFFVTDLYSFVMDPMQQLLRPGEKLVYTEPTEAFALYLKLAVIAGLMIASPIVMTQVWLFIAPGLYSHEKKFAVPFVLLSSTSFIAGAAFSHYVVFRMSWKFFDSFAGDSLTFMPRIEPAFSLYMKMLLGFGLVFQMPAVVLFLARMGLITARFLWRNFKYAILIIFVAAAILTPDASPVTQTAMAGPMILLYLLSICLAWLFGKKREPIEEDAT